MKPLNIAHRGGAQLMPENTLAAFQDAMARGCDGAELDVRLTRYGVVVVHHDFRLRCGLARHNGVWLTEPGPRIKDLSFRELQQFDVGSARPDSDYARAHPLLEPMDAKIPTLADVAALVADKPFRLFVELKCDANEDSGDPLALADAAFAITGTRAIYVGFDWRALARIRRLGGVCWFTTHKLPEGPSGHSKPVIDEIVKAGGQGWFLDYRDATVDSVAYARLQGLNVGAWTVNDPSDMRRLMHLDAICTDRPDLLADIIRA